MIEKTPAPYSDLEEKWHAFSHGIGAAFGVGALVTLVILSLRYGDHWDVFSSIVYSSSIILMFSASTLYHAAKGERAKAILKQLDHSAIYSSIAGTYTPFLLSYFRDSWGWWMFGALWGLTLLGIVLETLYKGRFKKTGLAIHLGMGWAVVLVAKPMFETVPTGALWLLLAGGLSYTLGVAFYVWKSRPFTHVVWHFFVLAGAVLHFLSILLYVAPSGV
ncbi:MAG: hemolysin III [Pseudoalteromonas tetraodonis]|jgi:hemolysin III